MRAIKQFVLLTLLVAFCACKSSSVVPSAGEKITITYSLQPIDSRFDAHPDSAALAIVDKYKPKMDALMGEVIGRSAREMATADSWNSPICYFTVDALLQIARQKNIAVDFSLYNIGGIRAGMPEGAVRVYDIYAVFPFDNDLVVLTIQGKYVRELITRFAQTHPEPMGNVSLAISQGHVKSMRINGTDLDDSAMYRIITNSFVADGGDQMEMLRKAASTERTGIMVRDAMIDYIRSMASSGKSIEAKSDDRIRVE